MEVSVIDRRQLGEGEWNGLLAQIMGLYTDVIEVVSGTDNDPLWVLGEHPSKRHMLDAADAAQLLIARCDGTLAGVMILNDECASGYEAVDWALGVQSDECAYVHLFAMHPDFRGRGLARPFMEAAEAVARQRGYKAIRLDTLPFNLGAQRTYERLGFDNRGRGDLRYDTYPDPDNLGFVMYEKAL